jgi:hypothetical protein
LLTAGLLGGIGRLKLLDLGINVMDLRFDVGDDLALQLFNFFGIRVAAHQAEQLHVVFEDHVCTQASNS